MFSFGSLSLQAQQNDSLCGFRTADLCNHKTPDMLEPPVEKEQKLILFLKLLSVTSSSASLL